MIVIIKKRENVNHAGFDDARKNSLDNGCHHKKKGECKCLNTGFDDAKSIIKQDCFNKHSKVKHWPYPISLIKKETSI